MMTIVKKNIRNLYSPISHFTSSLFIGCFFLSACSNGSVEISPVEKVPVEKKVEVVEKTPVPTTWQLDQFESSWSEAHTNEGRSRSIGSLEKFAASDFRWTDLWTNFRLRKFTPPPSGETENHQALMGLAAKRCSISVWDSYSQYALSMMGSDRPESIRKGYFHSAFGKNRICDLPVERNSAEEAVKIVWRDRGTSNESTEMKILALENYERALRFSLDNSDSEGDRLSPEIMNSLPDLGEASVKGKVYIDRLIATTLRLMHYGNPQIREIGLKALSFTFSSPELLAKSIEACLNSSECNFSRLVESWRDQPDYVFSQIAPSDLLHFLEVLEKSTLKILVGEGTTISAAKKILDGFITTLIRVESFLKREDLPIAWPLASQVARAFVLKLKNEDPAYQRRRLEDYIRIGSAFDGWLAATVLNARELGAIFKSEELNKQIDNSRSVFDRFFLFRTLSHLEAPTARDVNSRWDRWCEFLSEVGFPKRKLSAEQWKAEIAQASFEQPLRSGCVELDAAQDIQILQKEIYFSPDSPVRAAGVSIHIISERVEGGVFDLSRSQEALAARNPPDIKDDASLRHAIVFPFVFEIQVEKSAESEKLPSAACSYEAGKGPPVAGGLIKGHYYFCSGIHAGVFHLPYRRAENAPAIRNNPVEAEGGGSLEISLKTPQTFGTVLFSFGAAAIQGFLPSRPGHGDESHPLVRRSDLDLSQMGVEQFIAKEVYPKGAGDPARSWYFHDYLSREQMISLLQQSKISPGKDGRMHWIPKVNPNFISLLHASDREKIKSICGSLELNVLGQCFERMSDLINDRLVKILKTEPDAANEEELAELSMDSYFSAFGKVSFPAAKSTSQGQAGAPGKVGQLKIRVSPNHFQEQK